MFRCRVKKKNTVNTTPCLQGGKDTIVTIAFISLYHKKKIKKILWWQRKTGSQLTVLTIGKRQNGKGAVI